MNQDRILRIVKTQRDFFQTGETLPLLGRLCALRQLRDAILSMQDDIQSALFEDLGKSATESHLSEISLALSELRFFLRHLGRLTKVRAVPSSLAQLPGKAEIIPCPRGCVLVISPWNYPFLLTLQPAIAAIAAGNTVILKPSEYAPATARVLHKILSRALPPALCALVPGKAEETQLLLAQQFDHIFYTGGATVGRIVMEKAAVHLTPLTLELGGKSPCIVDETANIPLAARRIVFGKYLNCGQTCVAPDYLLVQESVLRELLTALRHEIRAQYSENPLENPDYGRIVNRRHFDRLLSLIDAGTLAYGGASNQETLQIAPTVLCGVTPADPVMQEEIFGPILPIISYQHLDDALAEITSRPHPLAFYLFSENAETQRHLMQRMSFGGGCINDTILHLTSLHLPFGGVGESGMGAYHGKAGFDIFTHYKSVLTQSSYLDFPLRYAPYTSQKSHLLRLLLR